MLDRDDIDKGIAFDGRTLSKAEVRAVLRGSTRMLEDHIPARQAFLTARQQAEQQANQTFEWMKAPTSEEYGFYRDILKREPLLMTDARGPWLAAVQVEGLRSLRATIASQKKGAGPAKEERKAAPADQLAGGASPGPVRDQGASGRAKAALEAEMQNLKTKSGGVSRDQVAKFLLKREQAQSR